MTSQVQTRQRGQRPAQRGQQQFALAAAADNQQQRVAGRLSAPTCSAGNNKFSLLGLASSSSNHSNSNSSASANSRAERREGLEATRARDSIDSDSSDYESAGLVEPENRERENWSQPQDDKHHHSAGSVMGIFFKVWSLVKVTRARGHQKLRRQNSEETGRFQYISGDQLPARNAAPLADRHFRRAGSQPPASRRPALEPLLVGGQQSARPSRQPGATSAQAGAGQLAPTTGANSTSSGVSSSTSSTLANSSPSAASAASVRRHLSAYSLRRSAGAGAGPVATSAAVVSQPAVLLSSSTGKQAPGNGGHKAPGTSWTSKIKRSATSVNQADLSSYASRFRFTGQRNNGQQQQQQQSAQRQQRQLWPQVNQPDDRNSDRQQRQAFAASNACDASNSSEEDSNDIYSTPNDSIQSVPFNLAPTLAAAGESSLGADAKSPAPANPLIKSFSTTNFSQLLQQQQQQQFAPIDELAPGAADLQRQDSSQSAASAASNANTNNNKRLNGSRFFISSSSSEDSSSPNQQQRQQQQLQPSGPNLLQQDHRQLALNQGVHFHAQAKRQQLPFAACRPDSLVVSAATPSSILISSATPTAATMQSPLDCIVSSRPSLLQAEAAAAGGGAGARSYLRSVHYRKSPSLFEISRQQAAATPNLTPAAAPSSRLASMSSRFSSKYPAQVSNSLLANSNTHQHQPSVSSFRSPVTLAPAAVAPPGEERTNNLTAIQLNHNDNQRCSSRLPNSISLHDCKLNSHRPRESSFRLEPPGHCFSKESAAKEEDQGQLEEGRDEQRSANQTDEYKLAQMLLEFGSNPSAREASSGCTVLMQAILSDNLPTIKCLIERGVDPNETDRAGTSALDLACSKAPTRARLEILKLLIENRANLDGTRASDGTRLLDRLIAEHRAPTAASSSSSLGGACSPTGSSSGLENSSSSNNNNNKLPFIECLLQNGAKLGSATWAAASGKQEIQLRLLKKLCQDGYFLYKQSSIEAAVFRFEYALKRLAELEQQLAQLAYRQHHAQPMATGSQLTSIAARQIKFQTYLGLSRCERKRRFYKRALEFAHMAILVDSTAYEGYYSKAHILKDLGETDDSLLAIEQTWRLVDKSIESVQAELSSLQQQQEQLIYDGCFNLLLDSRRSNWIQLNRLELNGNLEYLLEARKYVQKLKDEILDDKLRSPRNKQPTSNDVGSKDEQLQHRNPGCQQQQIVSAS